MLSHRKHEALDQVVHALLAGTMLACSAFTAAELAAPRSLLLTAGRALACLMQGMWLVQARPTSPHWQQVILHAACYTSLKYPSALSHVVQVHRAASTKLMISRWAQTGNT